ncbi:MAG: S9 family peptidase, partial [Acidobacteriota bacterium]
MRHISNAIPLLLLIAVHAASSSEPIEDPSRLNLNRIFEEGEFDVERFGPARWMKNGSGYTTLEPSPDIEDAQDIVRYEPATGRR